MAMVSCTQKHFVLSLAGRTSGATWTRVLSVWRLEAGGEGERPDNRVAEDRLNSRSCELRESRAQVSGLVGLGTQGSNLGLA